MIGEGHVIKGRKQPQDHHLRYFSVLPCEDFLTNQFHPANLQAYMHPVSRNNFTHLGSNAREETICNEAVSSGTWLECLEAG